MTSAGLPVPSGFTITTEACLRFYDAGRRLPRRLAGADRRRDARARTTHRQRLRLGRESAAGLGAQRRARLDARNDGHDPQPRAQRRHRRRARRASPRTSASRGMRTGASSRCSRTSCWASTRTTSRNVIDAAKQSRGVKTDAELDAADVEASSSGKFKAIVRERPSAIFRRTSTSSCDGAIEAVFDSWNSKRAIDYRRFNKIPDDWGTAVNVDGDGLRQHGRRFGHRRRLHARSEHRREACCSASI